MSFSLIQSYVFNLIFYTPVRIVVSIFWYLIDILLRTFLIVGIVLVCVFDGVFYLRREDE